MAAHELNEADEGPASARTCYILPVGFDKHSPTITSTKTLKFNKQLEFHPLERFCSKDQGIVSEIIVGEL